jgi:hypothetical protein
MEFTHRSQRSAQIHFKVAKSLCGVAEFRAAPESQTVDRCR